MPKDGTATKLALMDAAEALILEQGFSATTVDKVIERAGTTKGTFFYHFKTKAELAHALVERYAALEHAHLERNLARAEDLSRDPVQQVLIFVGLFREMADGLTEPSPGCLFASYCYEAELFDDRVHAVIREAMLTWRARFGTKLQEAIETSPPKLEVDAESLADMMGVIFEGAFIVSKTLKDPEIVAVQLDHFRRYLELLFLPSKKLDT